MRKIPTVFVRNPDDRRHVLNEVTPGCEWVLAGEGVATRKYDGTCVMLDAAGRWWARREVKPGKTAPPNFVEVEHDSETGKTVGWEPADQSGFAKYIDEARGYKIGGIPTGTYELVGLKINANPEGYEDHRLVAHDDAMVLDVPDRSFEALRERFIDPDWPGWEGIVFHHDDGRMAKIKRRDFV